MSVEEVLEAERTKITFDIEKMSQFIYGKKGYKELKEMSTNGVRIKHDFNIFSNGRVQILKQAYKHVPSFINNLQLGKQISILHLILSKTQQMPGSIHLSMFLKCIQIMGSQQQKQNFIDAGFKYQKIGCYAQTQLGHGSDIRGLETTATFIEQTGQIQIHTPSISATKYWPGDLGVMANYALVFAQLIMKGKNYGVQPFLVKIRDQNWKPLPGIQAGDIGPKMSFYAKQNGYLSFNKVRVCRKSILSKFVQITQKGQLNKTGDPRVSYATMMSIRQFISTTYPKIYGQAITIAIRYSLFRQQFKNKLGQQIRIIDYQTQQDKLTTRISQYLAMAIGGNYIRQLCTKNSELVQKATNFSLMAETHACLCLGKALYSEIVYDGMQICRKACGGHGFSHYSGLPSLIGQYAANLTHEGQNTILYLQVARYVMKNYKNYMLKDKEISINAKYIESIDFLLNSNNINMQVVESSNWTMEHLRILFAQNVCCLVSKITQKLMSKPEQMSNDDYMSYHLGSSLQQLGKAHGVYFTYNNFYEQIVKQKNEQVKLILTDLCKLFGITWLLQIGSSIIERQILSPQNITSLNQHKHQILKVLRPNLIGIVDSFSIPQHLIRSGLAKGNPYQNYLQEARSNKMNSSPLEAGILIKNKMKEVLQKPKL